MSPKTQIILDGHVFHVAPGERLLDACDEAMVAVMKTQCRAGHCGRCAVRVVEGARGLSRPCASELETLEALSLPADARLGCQIIVAATGRRVVAESCAGRISPADAPLEDRTSLSGE